MSVCDSRFVYVAARAPRWLRWIKADTVFLLECRNAGVHLVHGGQLHDPITGQTLRVQWDDPRRGDLIIDNGYDQTPLEPITRDTWGTMQLPLGEWIRCGHFHTHPGEPWEQLGNSHFYIQRTGKVDA